MLARIRNGIRQGSSGSNECAGSPRGCFGPAKAVRSSTKLNCLASRNQTSRQARPSSINTSIAADCHQRGPSMHSVRPRPICRARNTFSPSIALWQHFIAPGQHATQRPSLFATKAAESHDDRDVDTGRLTSRARAPKQIRWMQNSKRRRTAWVERSGLKDINDGTAERALPGLGGETGSDLDMLLKKTYESFDTGEAYEGVVVKPIYSPPVDERTYPWLPSKQNPKESAEERSVVVFFFVQGRSVNVGCPG